MSGAIDLARRRSRWARLREVRADGVSEVLQPRIMQVLVAGRADGRSRIAR